MSTILPKVRHVLAAPQSRNYTCHWPGCDKQVPPARWGCKYHWQKLPNHLRQQIWTHYRPGQEEDGRPSLTYRHVAVMVQEWIDEYIFGKLS